MNTPESLSTPMESDSSVGPSVSLTNSTGRNYPEKYRLLTDLYNNCDELLFLICLHSIPPPPTSISVHRHFSRSAYPSSFSITVDRLHCLDPLLSFYHFSAPFPKSTAIKSPVNPESPIKASIFASELPYSIHRLTSITFLRQQRRLFGLRFLS
ncbi:unnamed protein product [Lactuca virosa]|uniref:Uncharacterized protein n=1 Tax=Lactuca virosa TaxID=75947 RepID=A0AAU9MM47_9ASTR|nr:unnamed protein product [Lactuca virosa]